MEAKSITTEAIKAVRLKTGEEKIGEVEEERKEERVAIKKEQKISQKFINKKRSAYIKSKLSSSECYQISYPRLCSQIVKNRNYGGNDAF